MVVSRPQVGLFGLVREKMGNLESQEEDEPRRVLWFKTISWLGQIRTHLRDSSARTGIFFLPFKTYRLSVIDKHSECIRVGGDLRDYQG